MAIENRAGFGELLRRYRLAAGLTQEALAATAGMSARGVSDLERGARRTPYRETVQRLAESLGLQANERAEFLSAASRPPRELPAPVSGPPRRHNLPMRLTSFVGRTREVARVRQLIRSNRLVTLTGPGGVGKTRLALEVGASLVDSYADGVWFVELASADDGSLVAQAVASTLGVREQPGRSYAATLADVLQAKHALLVLDNCEHVLEPCGALATDLIHMAPGVAVLTTSREPLSVVGEVSWIVPTLSVSEPSDDQSVSEAVQLFEERARAIRPDFQLNGNEASVADLCARLDGLPLAIELAAARTRALPVRALLQMLESATGGLPILTGGPRGMPERQRTLRSAIGWSYDLLDPGEQALFRRLAIFRGCTLDAIESVCIAPERGPRSTSITLPGIQLSAVDGATSLVSKSLLRMDEDSEGEPWYSMLETVREFALERLEASGEAPTLRRRHALFYMRLAEDIEPRLYGADQVALLNQLEQEHANFRLALDWCQTQGYVEPSFRLALGLWMFWSTHGHVAEGSARLESLLTRFPARGSDDPRLILRAQLCDAAGRLLNLEGDLVRARRRVEEALALMEVLEDTSGILNALSGLAAVANQQGDFLAARAYHERELRVAQAGGKPLRVANAMYHRAMLAHDQGEDAEAQALLDQCATIYAQHDDPRSLGFTFMNLGRIHQAAGDLERARERTQQALGLLEHDADRRAVALALADLGSIDTARRDFASAYRHLARSLRTQEEVGDQVGIAMIVDRFAELAAAQGDAARALRLCGAAETLRADSASRLPTRLQMKLDARFESARRTLGSTAEAVLSAGRALSRAAAIEEALATMPRTQAMPENPLSQREYDVAVLVARGLTNRQIAAEMVIAEGTVASHVVHILAKLGLASRAQVAVWTTQRLNGRLE